MLFLIIFDILHIAIFLQKQKYRTKRTPTQKKPPLKGEGDHFAEMVEGFCGGRVRVEGFKVGGVILS